MPDTHRAPREANPAGATHRRDHPNLFRGPFLRTLATLQNANLARGICITGIVFTEEPGHSAADHVVTLTIASMRAQDTQGIRTTLGQITATVTANTAKLIDQLHVFGPWSPPTEPWFPLGIAPEPTDPLQIYTDLLYEIGDHAAALHEIYSGTSLTLDRVTLSGPRDATIGVTAPDSTRYEAVVSLTDPAALVGIDFSLAGWVHTLTQDTDTQDTEPDEPCVIRTDWR